MANSITVRDMDPADESWLRRQSRHSGVSMEELVRQLIHEKRAASERRLSLTEAFAKHFGESHSVGLPPRVRYSYTPVSFSDEEST